MYCPYCGKMLKSTSRFCPYCGKQAGNNANTRINNNYYQPPADSPGRKPVGNYPPPADSPGRKPGGNYQPPADPPGRKPVGRLILLLIAVVAVVAAAAGGTYWFIGRNAGGSKNVAYYEPVDSAKIVYENGERFAESHLLLTATEDAKYKDVEKLVSEYGGEIIGYISLTQDYQIRFPNEKGLDALNNLIGLLEQNSLIESASLEDVFELSTDGLNANTDPWIATSNPGIGPSWYEVPYGSNWWPIAIGMHEVWRIDLKLKKTNVGLIDTFFDSENDDLHEAFAKDGIIGQDNVNVASEYTQAVIDEQNGVTPKISSSGYAHGTHTAGIIGARNNKFGICGVSQNAQLYGVSLYGNEDDWNCSIMAYKYAIASLLSHKVKVINISMGAETRLFAANMEASGNDQRTNKALTDLKKASASLSGFLKRCLKHNDFLIVKAAGNTSGYNYIETAIDKDHPYGYRLAEPNDPQSAYKNMRCSADYDFFGAITDSDVKEHIIVVGSVNCTAQIIDPNSPDPQMELPENLSSQEDIQKFLDSVIVTPQLRMYYTISSFSNIGNRVDIYAPGGAKRGTFGQSSLGVLSDLPDDKVGYMQGTSMAAPMVAGVASLIWGVDPDLTAPEVRNILLNSADDQYGLLTVNALRAVEQVYGHELKYDKKLEEASFFMGVIHETVTDSNGNTVKTPVNAQVVITDEKGKEINDIQVTDNEFVVDLAPGNYDVTITAPGYKTINDAITIEKEKTCFKTYEMTADSAESTEEQAIGSEESTKEQEEPVTPPSLGNGSSYIQVIENLESEYGELWFMAYGEDGYESDGLCYLNLIDFTADGSDELMAVCKKENEDHYTGFIYTIRNGNVELMYRNDQIEFNSGDMRDLIVVSYTEDTGFVFETGWMAASGDAEDVTFFWYDGNEISTVFRSKGYWDNSKQQAIMEESEKIVDLYDDGHRDQLWNNMSEVCIRTPYGEYFDGNMLRDLIRSIKNRLTGSSAEAEPPRGGAENNSSDPYEEIISKYGEILNNNYSDADLEFLNTQYPELNLALIQDAIINQYDLSYWLYDINQDGVDELLITTDYDTDNSTGFFYALYTQTDNTAIPLITDCAYRIMFYVCEDGSVIKYASGGAMYGEATVYKIGDYGHSLNYITRYDIDYENYPDTPYYNGDEWLSKDAFDRRYRMVDSAVFVQK